MSTNNHTKYDEDFKKSLVSLYQYGKTHARFAGNTASPSLLSVNVQSSTPPLKWMTAISPI